MRLDTYLLTGEQIRAGRALGRIDQRELAQRCGLSLETIRRLERVRGPVDAHVRTLSDIIAAFHELGIEFDVSADGAIGMRMCRSAGEALRGEQFGRPDPASPAQVVHRLVYCSTAVAAGDDELRILVADLAARGSARNAAYGVTAALVACEGRFLQAIEGDKVAVLELYGLISTDRRHRDLRIIESSDLHLRQFLGQPLCWTHLSAAKVRRLRPIDSSVPFLAENLSPQAATSLLESLRDQLAPGRRATDARRGPGPAADTIAAGAKAS
ncbi:MAG: BLUF domain-containing protein [Phenylobacterium sp.]